MAQTQRPIRETEQKALEINLDETVYGTFAEIGAGQEVARFFFQAGAAAGTIAKTMSAYDKTVSDAIYGPEPSGRYVCETRLYKMLDHEFALMTERLGDSKPEAKFFVFADTVSAINYQKTIKGNGWLGLRFQLEPGGPPNDLVVHARLLDPDNRQQQQAVGILGVNMVFGAFRHQNDPETLLKSLLDGLAGRVKIDLVRLTGPRFERVDNRLLSLFLVKNGLSDVAIFGPDGRGLHASEFLYRKNILIARGSFRPPTLVQRDMIQKSSEQFAADLGPEEGKKTFFLCEITLDNLCAGGFLDEKDFLDRADLLCALGQTVIVSDCLQHKKLIAYFAEYKIGKIGLVMGAKKLLNIISETVANNKDSLLAAFGEIFLKNVRFYIHPTKISIENDELIKAENLPISDEIKFLFKHLLETRQIVDIKNYNVDYLGIYHKKVLSMIESGDESWQKTVPRRVAQVIVEKQLFGWRR